MKTPTRNQFIAYGTAVMGLAALGYSIWPPELEAQYLTLSGSLLGIPALARAPVKMKVDGNGHDT